MNQITIERLLLSAVASDTEEREQESQEQELRAAELDKYSKNKHIQTFEILALENREVVQRAWKIFNLSPDDSKQSPWIVLQPINDSLGSRGVVGIVNQQGTLYPDYMFGTKYQFAAYLFGRPEEKMLLEGSLKSDAFCAPSTTDETYGVHHNLLEYDEIMCTAASLCFNGPINIKRTLQRSRLNSGVEGRLGNLWQTLDIFESAARNLDLNPSLSARLTQESGAESEREVKTSAAARLIRRLGLSSV